MLLHASCVAFGGVGVLIRGPSGSGKSTLCLRLIDADGHGLGAAPLRAMLVADDQVVLSQETGSIVATPPASLAGKLEIRGLGIVHLPHRASVKLALVVDLARGAEIERMPDDMDQQVPLEGVALKRLVLDARDASAPARLRAALNHFGLA